MTYTSLKYEEAAIHVRLLSAFETEKTRILDGIFENRRIASNLPSDSSLAYS